MIGFGDSLFWLVPHLQNNGENNSNNDDDDDDERKEKEKETTKRKPIIHTKTRRLS